MNLTRNRCGFLIDPPPLSAGDGGLLVCRLESSALASEKESRLLLFQDLELDLENLSCADRLTKAPFTSKDQ